ncbi:MAG: hypothetical protein KKE51_09005 [Gammaproteobacteria bacterium]|nr:hypothetical protein [Gammaproteobacteria bacterium]MBU1602530.1 hypothetical protein [Gammaproteobacteria bacterium]MBU2433335.1 hypothetical protein [Gammaproteobacteria bacterium]MBU2451251.1 hypothetical protein [Gammaproteobacteria bacterium]
MPFVSLDQTEEQPRRGFVPLADAEPKRGFVPLQTEDKQPSILKTIALENPLTAIAETGLNLASQAVALPVAGLAGLATEAGNALGLTEKKGADVVHQVGEALTYAPRSEMGQAATEIATYPFQKLAEAGQWVGDKTLAATDSPLVATAVDTAINSLPMLIGPAKKGAVAVKDRIAGKSDVTPEAIAPEAEAARPVDRALARDSVNLTEGFTNEHNSPIAASTNATASISEATSPRGVQRLGAHQGTLLQPKTPALESLWRGGDQGLPGMAEQLRDVPEGRRAEAQPEAPAITQGVDQGLLPGQRGLGDSGFVGRPEEAVTRRTVEGGRPTGLDGREGSRSAAVGTSDHAGQWTDHLRAAAQPAPILDPSAGPLSRSAAIARPDLVIRAKEATPAGPFGELIPDSGTVREAMLPTEPKAWVGFADDSGSLGVPRAEMPQIKAEHRGAMTQFMNARGVKHRAEEVRADLLKPTQAEFSPAKVKSALGFEGGERSILVSSDGYILDGHHQWLAKRAQGKTVDVIRFDAPIADLFKLSHDFPSSQKAKGASAEPARGFTPLAETQRAARPGTEYSFAPGNSYTGFINDATQPGAVTTQPSAVGRGQPIRREDILIPFAKELGASIYTGRVNMKNALGYFRRGTEEIRIKKHADLETTAHEMGHLLDSRVPAISKEWRNNTALRKELKSISYDQQKVSEGYAEGIRLYLTQPDVLQAKAPMVFDWLENFAQIDKKYGPTLRKAQEGMTKWFAQDSIDRARSKIGDHRPLSDAMNGAMDRFRQSVSDDLHGIYRMERELQGGKLEPVGAYESARLSRASASIADGAVRFGYPVKNADGSFTYRGKGLESIMKPVAERLDDALLYFVGRSAQELMLQGREHLFTKGEIRGMLQLETPEARKAFAEYQQWNRGVLDFAEAQGVLNPETRLKWKRVEYLPFSRVEQPGGLKGKPGDWAGIQALTGGTENIRDVLGNMIGNAAQLIDVAVKNEARVKIAELASKPGGGKFMAKIDTGSRPVKIGGSQVLDEMFKRYGIAVDGDAPAFFQFMLHNQPPAGGNVVAVLKGGKPTWYEVGDPILFRSLQAIDRPPMQWLTKWLGYPKRIGQMAITLTPDFMLANIARDTIMGSVMSRSGFRPVIDSLQGMRLRMTEDPLYKDYIANGGGLSSLYLEEKAVRAKLEHFYDRQGIDYRTVLDTPKKLMNAVETIADAFEMSTRLGEYKRAIDAGEHPRHAAYQGREVSTDFAMRGDSKALGFMYDTVMFLRPAVESMDRLYRGVAHDPNKAAIGAKTAMLALASVGLYLLNRDDPRYQDLNDWDRDANWHFFVGDQHFRYPKIWEIGAVASTAERTAEKLMQSDPAGLGKDFARIVGNTFSLNYMPQIVAPLVEQATNRNSFTKAPLETPGMENVQPFLRAKPNTSETMRAIGMATRDLPESLQVNPVRAEALLRGYLNTWGMYGLMLSDKAFFGDKQPEMRTDQMPVVRRFYSQEPPQHTKFETQFYDMLGEAKRLQGTLRELDRQGRPDIADQKELSPLAGEAKPLERAAKNLQGINSEMRDVRRAADLSPVEKRQRLDGLTVERNQLLKDAVLAAKAAQANR